MSEITATYIVHDAKHNPEKKAEGIALGLTVGSWTDLPELDQKQLKKHKGRVVSVEGTGLDSNAETVATIKIASCPEFFSRFACNPDNGIREAFAGWQGKTCGPSIW